jgi:hypothetical protein
LIPNVFAIKAVDCGDNEISDKINPSKEDINTWVDLMDLEEGRLPSK